MNRPRVIIQPQNMPPLWQPLMFLSVAPLALIVALTIELHTPILSSETAWATSGRAALHLITLGVFGSSVLGASIQLFPVVLGIPLRFTTTEIIAALLVWLFGITAIITHFFWPILQTGSVGGIAICSVLGYWSWKSRHAWHQMSQSAQIGIRTALPLLLLMTLSGMLLISAHTFNIGISPLQHALFGLGIIVPSLILSVGLHVIPMFYAPGAPNTRNAKHWYWLALISIIAIIFAPLIALVTITVLQLWMAIWLLRLLAKRRRRADATVRYWQLALVGQVTSTVSLWLADMQIFTWRMAIAVTLFTFIVPIIMGMSQRIGAFLSSLHAQRLGIKLRYQCTTLFPIELKKGSGNIKWSAQWP